MRGIIDNVLVGAGALLFAGCSASHDVVASGDAFDKGGAESDTDTENSEEADSESSTNAGASSTATRIRTGAAGSNQRDRSAGTAATSGNLEPIHYKLSVTVPSGGEEFRCLYAQIPADRGVVAIDHVESHYTPGSHHLLAYRSNLTSIPDGVTGDWDCNDGIWQGSARGSYYEAQQPDEDRQLPKGIAHKFQPGEVMILQAHYINATENDLDASAEMILHPIDAAEVEQEAGSLYFNDVNIYVPAHGSAKTSMSCELPQDISLALLWSHMHERGTHFVVTTDDKEAAQQLGTLYEESDWAEPKQREYPSDPPVILHRGTHINFSCEYMNDSDNNFVFGQSAKTNEMCILHGMYWPRMPLTSEDCVFGRTTRE